MKKRVIAIVVINFILSVFGCFLISPQIYLIDKLSNWQLLDSYDFDKQVIGEYIYSESSSSEISFSMVSGVDNTLVSAVFTVIFYLVLLVVNYFLWIRSKIKTIRKLTLFIVSLLSFSAPILYLGFS